MSSDNPFRAPERATLKRRVVDLWKRGNAETRDQSLNAIEAEQIAAWAGQPYHQKFIRWLRDEADKPVGLDVHGKMIVAATRANTLKEIIERVKRLEAKARSTLEGGL